MNKSLDSVPHWHSFAPHFKNELGHDSIYHQSVKQAVESLQLPFQAWISEACTVALESVFWKKFFKGNSFRKRSIDFKNIFHKAPGKKRVFFLESFGMVDFLTCALAFSLFRKKNDSLWVVYRYGLKQLRWGSLYCLISKLLKKKWKDQFTILTDSELIAADLQQSIKQPVELLPIPHTFSFQSRKKNKEVILWWPGAPRSAKGLKEIQNLTSLLDARASEVRLFCSSAVQDIGSSLPVERVSPILSQEDYLALLDNSDIILLPYDAQVYAYGTSGIFIEAVVAGKMPVVKGGSWLAFQLEKHDLSELIVDWTGPQLISQLLDLFYDEEIQRKLSVMRQKLSAFHSIETFARVIERIVVPT